MAIFYIDGFDTYEPSPPNEFSIRYSEYIMKIIHKLDLEHFIEYPYVALTTIEDFALIQFYL